MLYSNFLLYKSAKGRLGSCRFGNCAFCLTDRMNVCLKKKDKEKALCKKVDLKLLVSCHCILTVLNHNDTLQISCLI